jgi:tetratricopeptide (TPR) repeat protein
MAKQARMQAGSPTARPSGQAAAREPRLEDCRTRLESVELLLNSSRRDALALARALLDDVLAIYAARHMPSEARANVDPEAVLRALPEAAARDDLAAARRWLDGAGATSDGSGHGVVLLRRVVSDLARTENGPDAAGVAAFRGLVGRITWWQGAIAAAVVVGVLVLALLTRASGDRRAAEFESWFAQASEQFTAGHYAEAVERYRRAIAATPQQDRAADAWNNMGWALYQLGRYQEAVDAYRKALALRPAFALPRNNLDVALRKLDLKKAETARQQTPTTGK